MRDVWPEQPSSFGADALEWWRVFNGLLPGGAWSFIKCEGKRPIEPWPAPQRDVRAHVNTLRGWRGNIGYPCGPQPAGWCLVVVDVDPRAGGDESLITLRAEGLTIETVTVITGGEQQGQHLWFAHPDALIKASLPKYPGVDFIADRGMVIVPPSVTTHRYDFEYGWSLA